MFLSASKCREAESILCLAVDPSLCFIKVHTETLFSRPKPCPLHETVFCWQGSHPPFSATDKTSPSPTLETTTNTYPHNTTKASTTCSRDWLALLTSHTPRNQGQLPPAAQMRCGAPCPSVAAGERYHGAALSPATGGKGPGEGGGPLFFTAATTPQTRSGAGSPKLMLAHSQSSPAPEEGQRQLSRSDDLTDN